MAAGGCSCFSERNVLKKIGDVHIPFWKGKMQFWPLTEINMESNPNITDTIWNATWAAPKHQTGPKRFKCSTQVKKSPIGIQASGWFRLFIQISCWYEVLIQKLHCSIKDTAVCSPKGAPHFFSPDGQQREHDFKGHLHSDGLRNGTTILVSPDCLIVGLSVCPICRNLMQKQARKPEPTVLQVEISPSADRY